MLYCDILYLLLLLGRSCSKRLGIDALTYDASNKSKANAVCPFASMDILNPLISFRGKHETLCLSQIWLHIRTYKAWAVNDRKLTSHCSYWNLRS